MPAARETVIGKFVNQILFKVDKSSINEAKSAISEVKSFATKALGVIGIGFSFTQLSSLAEEFGGINDAIRGATRELGDQSEIQQKILKGAQDCREEYGAMAGSVTKLIQQNGKLFPVDDAVKFVSLVEKLEKGAGREANIDSTMDVLTKAMSSGKLDKTGFANLKSKAPEVVKAISSAVGVSEAQLQKLAESGKLSAKQLKDAFFASESEIQKNFDELGFGITDALKYVRNEWGLLIANLDDTFGITTRIGKAIRDGSDFLIGKAQKFTSWLKSVADKLGGVEQLLKLIALAATALFLATNGNKILSFLSGAVKLLKGFNIQTALAAAKWLLLFLVLEDVMPSDAEFVAALKERNLYRKNALCKYLLVAIENQGKEQIKTDALTIEHIMPQNKNLSTAWQRMLGTDWELVRERYLHTLGNLTLTGYNSELGDLPFAEKLDKLAEENTHVTVLYSDVKNKTEWNAQTMESRAERLSEEVLKLFPIELPTTKIDFSDPRYRLYTVSDPHNATYKFVNYYELLGERVSADSFAFMVRSVAGKLYDLNSSIIDRMARNLEVFPAWQNPVFAYDKDAIRNAVKLKNDSDIYISTGYSAYDCICFIKALLKKYDLDLEEDFVYSARPNSTALAGINWKNIAQEWCEERDKRGEIVFDIKNCEGRYVRFTTPFLNSVIPTNEDILSPWKTNNYYFYEITSDKNELYVQLYFYCKGITDEMRTAFQKLANLTDGGKLTQGYRLFFKSSVFTQAENSTKSEIKNHLYRCLEEVRAFEMTIQDKWDS